jgi:hypothetical protein
VLSRGCIKLGNGKQREFIRIFWIVTSVKVPGLKSGPCPCPASRGSLRPSRYRVGCFHARECPSQCWKDTCGRGQAEDVHLHNRNSSQAHGRRRVGAAFCNKREKLLFGNDSENERAILRRLRGLVVTFVFVSDCWFKKPKN